MNMHFNRSIYILRGLLLFSVLVPVNGQEHGRSGRKAQNPLLVTRKRHDFNLFQAIRPYQQNLLTEEWQLERRLRYNFTNDAGENKELELSYYVNDEMEADEITHDHLIVGSMHRSYVARLFRYNVYTYDREADRKKSSDKKLVSRQRCERDLKYLVDNLPGKKKSINPELAAFYDSFGHSEQGLLYGNMHWSGTPHQCDKRLIVDPTDSVVITGRHCKASIKSPTWNQLIRHQRDKLLEADNYFKYEGQAYDYERYYRIYVGICLPQSCDSEAIDWAQDQVKELTMHKLQAPYDRYNLIDLFCLPDETSELRKIEPMGKLFILISCLWVAAMVVATLFDTNQSYDSKTKSIGSKLISVMSFKRNWQAFTGMGGGQQSVPEQQLTNKQPSPNDLKFLNFCRVIFAPVVIYSHLVLFSFEANKYSSSNGHRYHSLVHAANGGIFILDGFITMSGFVACYIMLQQRSGERLNAWQWLYVLFKRYWRLAPLCLVVFWFNKHLLVYTNRGPNWDYGTNNMTKTSLCRSESWLHPLTMTSNFEPLHNQCMLTAFSFANEVFFYLVMPFAIISLSRWPRFGWMGIMSALVVSTLAASYEFYTNPRVSYLNLFRSIHDGAVNTSWDVHHLYAFPQYRIGPYLVGLLAAHYAFMVRSGQWKSMLYNHPNFSKEVKQQNEKRRKTLLACTFYTGLFICCSSYAASWEVELIPVPRSVQTLALFVSLLYSTSHVYMGIGMALVMVALVFGHAPGLNRFMSLNIWWTLGKLSFAIVLIHSELMLYLFQSTDSMMNLQGFDLVLFYLNICLFTYLISTALTLIVEIPISRLEHEFVFSTLIKRPAADEILIKGKHNKNKRD